MKKKSRGERKMKKKILLCMASISTHYKHLLGEYNVHRMWCDDGDQCKWNERQEKEREEKRNVQMMMTQEKKEEEEEEMER